MTVLTHLMRSDARHFRLAILLWTVLVVAETVVVALRPGFVGDLRTYGNIGMILGLLWAALQIGMLLIVPLILQAHPAVGTDAFWMTRPIPPRALFASKLGLLAALTVLLPCTVRLALMLWIHVPAREALFVTLDMAISSSAWLAVLMAGAALTLNLPRFALLCGAVIVCLVLLMTISLMRDQGSAATASLIVASAQPVMPPDDDPTQGILFLLCLTAGGCGLVALQYRTRLRRVSVPAAVGAIALAIVAIAYWPLPVLAVKSALPAWSGGVHLLAPDKVIQMDPQIGWFDGADTVRTGRTRVIVGGLEPGWMPRLQLLGVSATLDNGVTLPGRGRGFQSSPEIDGFTDNPDRVVAREVLGVERVFSSAPPRPEWPVLLAAPARSIPATLPVTAAYRGQFAVRLAHWQAVAALPLRRGAAFQDEGYRFAIEQIDAGPGERLTVRAREWRATSAFDRKPMMTYAFYVRNAQRTSAMAGNESDLFFEGMSAISTGLPFTMGVAGPSRFFLRAAVVSFPPSYGLQEQKLEWDPAWYADAELVIIRVTETGTVVRTVDMPQATMTARDN
jgi:hypothetical protein